MNDLTKLFRTGALAPMSFGIGGLWYHAGLQLDNRIGADGRTRPMFSTYNGPSSIYVRSSTCWAAGLTGMSAVRVSPLNPPFMFGVMAVAPDIVMTELHIGLDALFVGAVCRFVTEDGNNTVVERTVTATGFFAAPGTPSDDGFWVARLNSALPATIKPVKVLPANFDIYVPDLSISRPLPILRTDTQDWQASVAHFTGVQDNGSGGFVLNMAEPPVANYAIRNSWYRLFTGGTSGSGAYLLINGEIVLLTCHYSSLSGIAVHKHLSDINTAIASTGSASTLTQIDLSAFPHT